MLVLLRLALGCHFLYEGIWKIHHPDLFVGETEGFLSSARGPLAGLFYWMVPDIDGHQRLEGNLNLLEVDGKGGNDKGDLKLAKSWDGLRQTFVDFYRPAAGKDDDKKLHEQLAEAAKKVYERHVQGLREFIAENGEKIKAHFESLKRYEEGLKTDPHTMFQTQRRWEELQDLRQEAKGWIADLDSRESALKADLLDLLREERKPEKEAVAAADREAAASAAAKKAADAATKKAAKPETKKPVEPETKKAETGATPPQPPAAEPKPETVIPKSPADDRPSDPPKDLSSQPAKANVNAKETEESGSEESAEPDESKTPAAKSDKKKSDAETAKPRGADSAKAKAGKAKAADESKPAAPSKEAPAAPDVVDFSPLAKSHSAAGPFAPSGNPLTWTRIEQLAFLLTWALFGIGLCLVLGLFARLSALGGAAFMLFVVLSHPSYPGIYPLDAPQMGHSLLVNEGFRGDDRPVGDRFHHPGALDRIGLLPPQLLDQTFLLQVLRGTRYSGSRHE